MLLAITTATPRCTVALVERDGTVVAELGYEDELNHAERVFGTLDALFQAAGASRADLEQIVCDVGPGSFTGVRVGLASAKGIALGLSVPLLGVGSLQAMAAAAFALAPPEIGVVCALLDAKRGETFVGAYDRRGEVVVAPRHEPTGSAGATVAALGDAVLFCGRAAAREGLAPILDDPSCELPSATWLARVALSFRSSPPALGDVEPVYLRAPDAKKLSER